uniref:Uncharacterized protein n=1 Tax=Amphimedon queenslandica TaxID=400682 RepID=A0A1X7TJ58_AMPQE
MGVANLKMDEQLFATACACGVVAGIIAAYAAKEDMYLSAQEEESEVEEEEDNEQESVSRTGRPSLSIDIYEVVFESSGFLLD